MGKAIEIAGPDFHNENTISFRREKNGLFRKLITQVTRDRKTGVAKEAETQETDQLYEVVNDSDDYDEKLVFEDGDGGESFLKLRLVEDEDR